MFWKYRKKWQAGWRYMYVYADVVLILNLIMNSIILRMTAGAAGVSFRWWRILFAAAWGSVYVLGGMFSSLAIFYTVPVKVLLSVILILLAFGRRQIRVLLLLVGAFYITSFILGGAVIGWLYFLQTNSYVKSGDYMWSNMSWVQLAGGSCIAIVLMLLITRRLRERTLRRQIVYQVKIEYDGLSTAVTAMLDTGNGLYTIIGRKPVVLVTQRALQAILSNTVTEFLQETNPEMWLVKLDGCKDEKWLARVQIIPYHAVGNRSMLLGFRPDCITVVTETGIITTQNVVIGVYDGALSGDDSYDALLHPAVLHGLNNKEEASVCA
jgi:stage II sporulation protein GA (sporulation sigma-E factor processing peptidase)